MAMLHTVNKSPFERNALASCLRLAQDGASVLLIEDGVLAALADTEVAADVKQAMKRLNFYVLIPDLQARGFSDSDMIDTIKAVDYSGFVELVVEHDSVQAWL